MTTENTDKGQTLTEVDSQGHCALGDGSAPLTGGCLMARGGRVLRHGEVISEHDYTVRGGLANPATPVPSEWVGRRIFEGLPQPAVIRVPKLCQACADSGWIEVVPGQIHACDCKRPQQMPNDQDQQRRAPGAQP